MARCKDCDVCGFDRQVRFSEKYLVFLCKKCEKKRGDEDGE